MTLLDVRVQGLWIARLDRFDEIGEVIAAGLSARAFLELGAQERLPGFVAWNDQDALGSIKDIAYSFEFSDPSNFNRFFKKLAGITPQQYRDDSN